MSKKSLFKVGDAIFATGIKMDMYGKTKELVITKVVRKYDPRKQEGYTQIHCGKEIYDARDGRCIVGDEHYKI